MQNTGKSDGQNKEKEYIERRGKPRMRCQFPAIVRGKNASGDRFQVAATLENLSASGISLRMEQPVDEGARLFVVFRFATAGSAQRQVPQVATQGTVLRSEASPDRHYRLAVRLQHYRFL